MYYGDPGAEGVIGTQPRRSSHWAYKFGSISIILEGERLTLAAVPVMHEPRVKHVKKLIEHALLLGIRPKIVLLDGAYNSAWVINYLNSTGLKYIIRIAAPIDGIKPGDDFTYTSRGNRRRKEEQATFRLLAVNGRDRGGRVRLFVFATNTNLKPRRIRRLFRKRWGIETSYRMINKFLARTTSKLYTYDTNIVLLSRRSPVQSVGHAELPSRTRSNHRRLAEGVCCSGCRPLLHP